MVVSVRGILSFLGVHCPFFHVHIGDTVLCLMARLVDKRLVLRRRYRRRCSGAGHQKLFS